MPARCSVPRALEYGQMGFSDAADSCGVIIRHAVDLGARGDREGSIALMQRLKDRLHKGYGDQEGKRIVYQACQRVGVHARLYVCECGCQQLKLAIDMSPPADQPS